MTRKRFVKLLMSYGCSRNEAVFFANSALVNHRSYMQEHARISSWLKLQQSCRVFTRSFVSWASQFWGRLLQ